MYTVADRGDMRCDIVSCLQVIEAEYASPATGGHHRTYLQVRLTLATSERGQHTHRQHTRLVNHLISHLVL